MGRKKVYLGNIASSDVVVPQFDHYVDLQSDTFWGPGGAVVQS